MAEPAPYSVEVYKGFWVALETQPPSQQGRVTQFMVSHLSVRPRATIPGQSKRLKATYSHLYQLDCGKDRLLYEVDDDLRTVRIVYLGPHPEWEKRGKKGRI